MTIKARLKKVEDALIPPKKPLPVLFIFLDPSDTKAELKARTAYIERHQFEPDVIVRFEIIDAKPQGAKHEPSQ